MSLHDCFPGGLHPSADWVCCCCHCRHYYSWVLAMSLLPMQALLLLGAGDADLAAEPAAAHLPAHHLQRQELHRWGLLLHARQDPHRPPHLLPPGKQPVQGEPLLHQSRSPCMPDNTPPACPTESPSTAAFPTLWPVTCTRCATWEPLNPCLSPPSCRLRPGVKMQQHVSTGACEH